MDTSFGDVGKDREITIVVEQEMELDSPLRLAEGGPVKESGAKVDDGGVKAEELILEAKLLSRGNGPTLVKKLIKHFLIELPRTFLIGIGQRRPGRGCFYAEMLQLPETA